MGALVVDPKRPNTMYAGVGATVLKSDDAGESWKTISQGGGSDDQALPRRGAYTRSGLRDRL